MADGRRQPQPGDLIEINGKLHHHWALYIGDGYVIDLLPIGKREVKQEGLTVTVFIRTVKKELLGELAGKYTWRVNNKSDQDHTPLPVEKIISCAVAYIGKELTYCSFGSNCERFVKKLRYGEGVSEQRVDFVSGEMGILDMRDDEEYPKPGDLIEIKQGHDQHWALYVGRRYVIHVTPVDEGAPSLSGSSDTRRMRKAKVKKELLREVARNKKWRISNEYDFHCPPLPVEEIIRHAEGCVGTELTYDELKFKSVHFLSKLRHVGLWRDFVSGEMDILDMRDDEEYPKPGDLIEIKQGHDQHWALYVGGGYVIHVTPVDEGAPSLSGSSDTRRMRKAKVKKELLREVARNKKWRVNNECDCHRPPLPVEEIIWHAEGCVGKKMTYDELKFKSVHFLSKLRHVGLFRAFEGGKIHRHDSINRKYLPIPGDLIEIKRPFYQHWAIYVGGGYVIHVTPIGAAPCGPCVCR
uniref:LRAT domain-containing protein n=1 Tax=Ficedula albicollis TaxID=59894 RepID=U3JXT7_FICAL